jgi:hypothetical protein
MATIYREQNPNWVTFHFPSSNLPAPRLNRVVFMDSIVFLRSLVRIPFDLTKLACRVVCGMLRGARGQFLSRRVPSLSSLGVLSMQESSRAGVVFWGKINFPRKGSWGFLLRESAECTHMQTTTHERASFLNHKFSALPPPPFLSESKEEAADVFIFLSRPSVSGNCCAYPQPYIYDWP